MNDFPNYEQPSTVVRLFGKRIWTIFCLSLCLLWAILFRIIFTGSDSFLKFMFCFIYIFLFPKQLLCFLVFCLIGLFGQKKILSAFLAIVLFCMIFMNFSLIADWGYQKYDNLRWKLGIPIPTRTEEMCSPQSFHIL